MSQDLHLGSSQAFLLCQDKELKLNRLPLGTADTNALNMAKFLTRGIGLFLIALTCLSCQASPKDKDKVFLYSEKADGWGNALNDSLAIIISSARKVTCELLEKSTEDPGRIDSISVLSKKEIAATEFVLLTPDNFKTDKTVYGIFRPWVSFTFSGKKKQEVSILLDFGLSKWQLISGDGKIVFQKDLTNRAEIIRLVRVIFPKDITLKLLQQNLNASIKK